MGSRLSLEEKCRVLKDVLDKNLHRKHLLELSIGKEFEQLKILEIALEKRRVGVGTTQRSD